MLLVASAAVLLVFTSLAVGILTRGKESPVDLIRFAIVPADRRPLTRFQFRDFAVSPDGARVAYTARTNEGDRLFLRTLDALEITPLAGEVEGAMPFFSPDGESVGFVSTDESGSSVLMRVSVQGGTPVTVTRDDRMYSPRGASWVTDGSIVVGTRDGLLRVQTDGTEPGLLTGAGVRERHVWPSIIHGHDAILFTHVSLADSGGATNEISVLDLETGEVSDLGLRGRAPHYASTGYLVYTGDEGTSVWAVSFDTTTLEVTGVPVLVLDPE